MTPTMILIGVTKMLVLMFAFAIPFVLYIDRKSRIYYGIRINSNFDGLKKKR